MRNLIKWLTNKKPRIKIDGNGRIKHGEIFCQAQILYVDEYEVGVKCESPILGKKQFFTVNVCYELNVNRDGNEHATRGVLKAIDFSFEDGFILRFTTDSEFYSVIKGK